MITYRFELEPRDPLTSQKIDFLTSYDMKTAYTTHVGEGAESLYCNDERLKNQLGK